ncbi:MAG: RNA-binding S4 domain-containing protein [Solitalea-like symbiont of Tyrophagus putrescentiae]
MGKCINNSDGALRLDKFLWCIRFFKTRSSASKACNSGKIKSKQRSLKASSTVKIGDIYTLDNKEIEVISLPKSRYNAEAVKLYYKVLKQEDVNSHNIGSVNSKSIKPTKKQRRTLIKLLGNK